MTFSRRRIAGAGLKQPAPAKLLVELANHGRRKTHCGSAPLSKKSWQGIPATITSARSVFSGFGH